MKVFRILSVLILSFCLALSVSVSFACNDNGLNPEDSTKNSQNIDNGSDEEDSGENNGGSGDGTIHLPRI